VAQLVKNIITDYHQSVADGNKNISFPGERVLQTRRNNLTNGIPVLKEIWEKVLSLGS
jgi:3-dehydro-L-gulonate 2-dehydrogenase